MVQFLPSSATAQVTVTPNIVDTVLTLIVPPDVVQGESFLMSGELRRTDTNGLLAGETITAVYNGTALGSDVTQNGTYNIDGVINEMGTYTVTVNFAGSTRPGLTLRPSQGTFNVILGAGATVPLMVGGIAALSVILMAISLK